MRIKLLVFFSVGVSLIIGALLYQLRDLYTGYPSASDFKAHEHKYVAIVDFLSKVNIPAAESVYFYCDSDWDVRKIKAIPVVHPFNGNMGHYNIEATRLDDGSLVVTLITKDLGHSGLFAYVYSSGDTEFPDETGNWTIDETLSRHWWVVSNRLG